VYAVYGDVDPLYQPGGSGTPTFWAGYFNGDLYGSGTYQPSDRKLKKEITPAGDVLDKIMQLRPSTYIYNSEQFKAMNFSAGTRYGFIADELETVFPQLTKKSKAPAKLDKEGNIIAEEVEFTAVNYVELIPVLTKAIQEQQLQIETLKKQIAVNIEDSKTKISVDGTATQKVAITESAVLFQNHPNPMNGVTFIEYYIPATAGNAFLKVVDINGKLIQAFPINQNGYGQIELDCSKLAPGTYHYSLMVNAQLIDSKSMIVAVGK
jgi:hypothetical protein